MARNPQYPWRVISASQMGTAEYSPRKWFFEKIMKLKVKRKSYFGFGTTLAECLERYLLAAHTEGIQAAFPESYQPMAFGRPERGVGLSHWSWRLEKPATEGPLITQLVQEAVDKGFLRRSADAWVEWELPRVPFGGHATLWGYGDLAYPEDATVLDHKSVKIRKYIMSRPQMQRDIQLILYAYAMLQQFRDEGREIPDTFTVGHVAYIKDGAVPFGKRVELKTTTVTPADIDTRMVEIHGLAEKMHAWAEASDEEWKSVPCGGSNCMRKYGGCPFVGICGGEQSPEEYEKSLDAQDRLVKMLVTDKPKAKEATTMVNVNDLLARLKAGQQPAAPAPKAPAVAEPVNPTPTAAPWASEECPHCGGTGWNEDGSPCAICVGTTGYDMSGITLVGPFEYAAAESPQEAPQEVPAPVVSELKRVTKAATVSAADLLASLKGRNVVGTENKEPVPEPAPAYEGEETEPFKVDAEAATLAADKAEAAATAEPTPEPQAAPVAPAPVRKAPSKTPAVRGRPKLTTFTFTIKTADATVIEKLTEILARVID